LENLEVKLIKEKNEYFKDWIYKIWHHHDTIDKIYQCNYDVEIKFGENEFYYKILKDDIEIGFIGLDLRNNEILDQHTLYINRFYIDEEYRNMGIGEQVLNKIIGMAKEMNRDLELEVFGDNPAIHLYEKMGFKIHYRDMILKI